MSRLNLDFVRTTGSGTGAISLAVPAGTVSGDALVVAIATDDVDAVVVPAGWTQAAGSPLSTTSGGGVRLTVAYKIAGASEPAFTAADPGDHWVGQMVRITGDLVSPLAVRGSASRVSVNEGTEAAIPSLSAAQAQEGDFLLLCAADAAWIASSVVGTPRFLGDGVTDEGYHDFIGTSSGTDSSVWMSAGHVEQDAPSAFVNYASNRTSVLLALAIEATAANQAGVDAMELVSVVDNLTGAGIEGMELVTVLVEAPPPGSGDSALGFMGFVP